MANFLGNLFGNLRGGKKLENNNGDIHKVSQQEERESEAEARERGGRFQAWISGQKIVKEEVHVVENSLINNKRK